MRFVHRKPNLRSEFFLVKPRGRAITRNERRVWKLSSHSVNIKDYQKQYNHPGFYFKEISDQKQTRQERIVLRKAGLSTLREMNMLRFRPRPGENVETREQNIVRNRHWIGIIHRATARAKVSAAEWRELFD
jgi:hypothetical protein